MRMAIVEPVFGQTKSERNLHRVLLRGLTNVRDEFRLITLTHNVLKLHCYCGAHANQSLLGETVQKQAALDRSIVERPPALWITPHRARQ
jgi:hypothetical protein